MTLAGIFGKRTANGKQIFAIRAGIVKRLGR